jgi:uncharacterized protein YjbK
MKMSMNSLTETIKSLQKQLQEKDNIVQQKNFEIEHLGFKLRQALHAKFAKKKVKCLLVALCN